MITTPTTENQRWQIAQSQRRQMLLDRVRQKTGVESLTYSEASDLAMTLLAFEDDPSKLRQLHEFVTVTLMSTRNNLKREDLVHLLKTLIGVRDGSD